ncbi:MAG TPA: alpha/beta hydrolase [Allosphingosinicella sp.]|jgi:pimeloyl-ACP methyl ester carboxylesterase
MKAIAALLLLTAIAAPSPAAAAAPKAAAVSAPAFASERIGVTVRGSGPDVVLIPGLSSSPDVWNSTIEALPGYRYHVVHVAGFAGRAPGANASGEVVAPVAEEIARYIRESKLKQPAIVGHSLGGAWAMMVASKYPDLASKIMVVDMMPFMGAMFGGPTATPDTIRPIAEQIRTGIASSNGDTRTKMTEQTIAGMVKTESLRPAAVAHTLSSDATVSGQAMYDLLLLDLRPALKNIKVPMQVLWVRPAGAPISEEQMGQFYQMSYANAPQAKLTNVPNAYHFIMWDAPEAFQRELKAFLAAK